MKLSRSLLIVCIVFLSIGLIIGLILHKNNVKPTFEPAETVKVLIDAGHGALV